MNVKSKHGGAQEESKLIKRYADQWCKDNGYPLQKREYVYWIKGYKKWKKKDNVHPRAIDGYGE